MQASGGVYLLKWSAENVVAAVSRLRESHDTVTAEVSFKTTSSGHSPTHLHQARLNLLSTTTRKSFAAALTTRIKELDWDAAVEQLCMLVLDHYRQGEPVVTLGEIPAREGNAFRVFPLLLENQANLFYGNGGSGKTKFATFLATLITSPLQGPGLEVEPGNVLYLDWEASAEDLDESVKMIQAGLGIESASNIRYRYCFQPLADDIAHLRQLVLEHEIDMVVVDSIGAACGGEPESADVMLRYFLALRSLKVTTLSIHHINKEGKLYGNQYIFNYARNIWEMKKAQELGEDTLSIGLYHRKMNNGKLLKPLGFKMHFNESAVHITKTDVRDVPELASGLPIKDQIYDVLRRHSRITALDISQELGVPERQVIGVLRSAAGRFQRIGDLWQLKESYYSPGKDSP